MKIGVVVLPEYGRADTLRIWRDLDQLGIDHGWTYDHIAWRTLGGEPWFDGMSMLAAAAVITERVRLGTLVVSPNYRHPVPTAQQIMTLDQLSAGRAILGIGAGTSGSDAVVLGGPRLQPADRFARFEEFVELTDILLRQPYTTFRGRFFNAVDARMVPGCVQRPRTPLAIAASGPRGMNLAASRGDIWVTIGDAQNPGGQSERAAFALLGEQAVGLADACHRRGRPPAHIRRLVNLSRIVPDPYSSAARLVNCVGRCNELGFTDVVVNYPRHAETVAGDRQAFERAMQSLLDTVRLPALDSPNEFSGSGQPGGLS